MGDWMSVGKLERAKILTNITAVEKRKLTQQDARVVFFQYSP